VEFDEMRGMVMCTLGSFVAGAESEFFFEEMSDFSRGRGVKIYSHLNFNFL